MQFSRESKNELYQKSNSKMHERLACHRLKIIINYDCKFYLNIGSFGDDCIDR
jgi:hypothetical protein